MSAVGATESDEDSTDGGGGEALSVIGVGPAGRESGSISRRR